MNGIKLGAVALLALAGALGGCDDKTARDEKPTADAKDDNGDAKKDEAKGDAPTKEAKSDADAKEDGAKEDGAKDEADGDAPAGDAMTVADLTEKFAADEAAWIGKEVTVSGVYMNANFVKSGGEEQLNNVVVVPKKGEMNPSITCDTNDKASIEGLKQYDAVKITGKVRKSFSRPALESCTLTR